MGFATILQDVGSWPVLLNLFQVVGKPHNVCYIHHVWFKANFFQSLERLVGWTVGCVINVIEKDRVTLLLKR